LHDIRMVYNVTSSGLNNAVWVPWFSLPTVESHLRAVDPDTYMADNYIGKMFLNFMLDVEIRPFAGVDLRYSQRSCFRVLQSCMLDGSAC